MYNLVIIGDVYSNISYTVSGKIWWRIKFHKLMVDDACVKLNPVNINID